jgi:DNA repair protein SbcD/Mre11
VEQDGERPGEDGRHALTHVRILHTSDWHAGKAWKGQSRLDELEAVLDDLAAAVERERIDLVLMTGDVFDTSSPSAEAERLVFRFFRRVGQLRVPSVVIAGNHDSPARVEAWAQLAELAQVTACGLVKAHDAGGCVSMETASGQRAVIGMVPFVGPAQFLSAEELGASPDEAGATYARRMQHLVARISSGFRADAVNILMAHTHLQGAAVGTSERRVHVAEEWAAAPAMLPTMAQYVALGHIHRHQQIMAAPVPTWYAGAPMQLDFGEEGEPKAYNIVEATPGRPARVETRPYVGARPLRTVTVTAAELVRVGTRIRIATRDETPGPGADLFAVPIVDVSDHAHLRVIVDCTAGAVDPEINRKVRAAIPGVVSVDILRRGGDDATTRPAGPDPGRGLTLSPRELYVLFLQQHGATADEATLAAFDTLYQDALASEVEP